MNKSRRQRASRLIVGLMSGTSADGIDAVLARLSGTGAALDARLVAHVHRKFPDELRRRILNTSSHGTVGEICELNFVLGEQFARAALAVVRKAGVDRGRVAAIASHGQTVHHLPNARVPSTMQIGEGAVIAERTGICTVSDFRVRDMAAGGQGAPLVAYADWALFRRRNRSRILLNIGGIANVTFLPAGAELSDVVAFDTGPGNMLIDAVASHFSHGQKRFDRGGAWAARGHVSAALLTELMRHPFLRRRPPKTTGREEFGKDFVTVVLHSARRRRLTPADMLATVTAFTARSIARSVDEFLLSRLNPKTGRAVEMFVAGGGARNLTLMKMLAEAVPSVTVRPLDELGFSSAVREALAFAVLAHETLQGVPSNVSAATGARHPVVLGSITPVNQQFEEWRVAQEADPHPGLSPPF